MSILKDPEIIALTETLKRNHENKKYCVSDLILNQDEKEYQFVDLVMEGGGTLGIGLVGYIYALEQAGIRFLSIGGSSVGAIVSLLLATSGEMHTEKSIKLTDIICSMDMESFIDGSYFPKKLSKKLGASTPTNKLHMFLLVFLSRKAIFDNLGLNKGDEFLKWLKDCLSEYNIKDLEDVKNILSAVPEKLYHREYGLEFRRPKPKLKIVTADLTTTTKVVFPDMSYLYFENPDEINPALFARASMSIPLFFEPFTVSNISKIPDIEERWDSIADFNRAIPDKAMFTDGGMISNFPISLFHLDGVPNAPTFGIRLGSNKRSIFNIDEISKYAASLFSSLRFVSDYEFIKDNPDYNKLIGYVDTSAHNWLNFYMSMEEKTELFKKGMLAAIEFLDNFNWQEYKEIRKNNTDNCNNS